MYARLSTFLLIVGCGGCQLSFAGPGSTCPCRADLVCDDSTNVCVEPEADAAVADSAIEPVDAAHAGATLDGAASIDSGVVDRAAIVDSATDAATDAAELATVSDAADGSAARDAREVDASSLGTGLILHLPLDVDPNDATGNHEVFCDSTAAGTQGNCTFHSEGAHSYMTLDGASYLRVPSSQRLNTPLGFTIAGWIRMRESGLSSILSLPADDAYSNTWILIVSDTDPPNFWTANQYRNLDGSPVALNEWTQLVATWDRGTERIYLNGVLVGTHERLTSYAFNGLYDMLVGAELETGRIDFLVRGDLDDIRVYGRALSAAEVSELFGAPD